MSHYFRRCTVGVLAMGLVGLVAGLASPAASSGRSRA